MCYLGWFVIYVDGYFSLDNYVLLLLSDANKCFNWYFCYLQKDWSFYVCDYLFSHVFDVCVNVHVLNLSFSLFLELVLLIPLEFG